MGEADVPELGLLTPEQAAEVRRLPTPRLQSKVAREVLARGLALEQTRQLVNGMLQLKDFPWTSGAEDGAPSAPSGQYIGEFSYAFEHSDAKPHGLRARLAAWFRRFAHRISPRDWSEGTSSTQGAIEPRIRYRRNPPSSR